MRRIPVGCRAYAARWAVIQERVARIATSSGRWSPREPELRSSLSSSETRFPNRYLRDAGDGVCEAEHHEATIATEGEVALELDGRPRAVDRDQHRSGGAARHHARVEIGSR